MKAACRDTFLAAFDLFDSGGKGQLTHDDMEALMTGYVEGRPRAALNTHPTPLKPSSNTRLSPFFEASDTPVFVDEWCVCVPNKYHNDTDAQLTSLR